MGREWCDLWGGKMFSYINCVKLELLGHMCELAGSPGWMKYEADQAQTDSGWGRSGIGSASHQGILSQK